MARKESPSKASDDDKNVIRIKATGSGKSSRKKAVEQTDEIAETKPAKIKPVKNESGSHNPFQAITAYFKGAWFELRQVRWPDRQSTWSLTGAVLLFTAFFMVLILLLDALFQYVFKLILG